MLIILEGPDGSGKSTLARDIANVLEREGARVDVLHAGPLHHKVHPIDAYETPLANYRPGARHVVCDRWHLGEAVYPEIFDRPTKWNEAVAQHVHLFLQSRGALVILLQPDLTELKTRVKIRGDQLISLDQLEDISRRYEMLPARYVTRVYDRKTPLPRDIVNRAQLLHDEALPLNEFETYIGPPRPRVLLLGDERAPQARVKHPNLPAFAPFGATSGHWLLSHIRPASSATGMANACDVDNPYEMWCELGYPRIVALGRRAQKRLQDLGVPHGVVPHPQFVRRFYFRHGHEYGLAINEAARTRKDLGAWRP